QRVAGGRRQQALHVLAAEEARQFLLLAGAAQADRRVGAEDALAAQESAPGAERGELAGDAAAGEASLVQVRQVGAQGTGGQLLGARVGAAEPLDEERERLGQVFAVRLDRVRRGVLFHAQMTEVLSESFTHGRNLRKRTHHGVTEKNKSRKRQRRNSRRTVADASGSCLLCASVVGSS